MGVILEILRITLKYSFVQIFLYWNIKWVSVCLTIVKFTLNKFGSILKLCDDT